MRGVRQYHWSAFFAWGMILSGAALAMAGVFGKLTVVEPFPQVAAVAGVIGFAGLMGFGIGMVNCAASATLRAVKHRRRNGDMVDWLVFAPGLAATVCFAIATNVGVHMGWEVIAAGAPAGVNLPDDGAINGIFYIFAFAKPAAAWLIEGLKSMDREDAERADAERMLAAKRDERRAAEAPTAGGEPVANLEDERTKRVAERKGWPPITQERVAKACRALRERGDPVNATRVAMELRVGKDRVLRAEKAGEIRLAA